MNEPTLCMAIETDHDEPLPDEKAVIETRSEMLDDEDNLTDVAEFLERL